MSAPTTEHPTIDSDTLVAVVGEVFEGLFGHERGRPYEDDVNLELPVSGRVDVRGGWNSTIAVSCSSGLVRLAAAELFAIPFEAVTEADLRDVVGELANVIGGNVKSMMPGPSVLSLPTTAITPDDAPSPAPERGLVVGLSWCREHLRVELTTSASSAAAGADPTPKEV